MGTGLPIVVSWLKVYARKIDIIIVIIQFTADIGDGGEPFRRLNMVAFISTQISVGGLFMGVNQFFLQHTHILIRTINNCQLFRNRRLSHE